MTEYYKIINTLKDHLESDISVNSVTLGAISSIDFDKQTVYPLSNIDVNKATFEANFMVFEIQIFCLDIVDITKEQTHELLDTFYGNNNLQDVYNTQLSVVNGLQASLRRGVLNNDLYEIDNLDSIDANQVSYQGVNLLAGWEVTLSIRVPNTEIQIC